MKELEGITEIPSLRLPALTPETFNIIIIGLVCATIAFILIRLARNRIYVDIYEKVKGGYVSKPGRYKLGFNKSTNMHSLNSMTGKNTLPSFESKYYQKVSSMPIFGIRRQIKLVKINKNTHIPILPPLDKSNYAKIKDYNSLTWTYTEILRVFERKLKRGKFLYILSIAAPCIVILAAIAFLIVAMYTDQYLLSEMVKRIEEVSAALQAVLTK